MKNLHARLKLCDELELRKQKSDCVEYRDYCDYCIDIIRSGISSLYIEVFQFLEMDEEITDSHIKEVDLIISMYEEIELMLKDNSELYNRYKHQLFTGFTDYLCESYYLFLKRNNKISIPRHPGKAKSLKEYRKFLKHFKTSIIQKSVI